MLRAYCKMERVCWRLQLRLHWCYNYYVDVTTMLRLRTISRHVYYVLLMYLCNSCFLVRWLCFHNLYCVVNTLTYTCSGLNGAVWGQGQYAYAIATVITILLLLLMLFVSVMVSSLSDPCLSLVAVYERNVRGGRCLKCREF